MVDEARLPRYLCSDCYKRCVDWKEFLDLVRESNKTLHMDLLASEMNVREESVSEEQPESNVNSSKEQMSEPMTVDPEEPEPSDIIVKEEPVDPQEPNVSSILQEL